MVGELIGQVVLIVVSVRVVRARLGQLVPGGSRLLSRRAEVVIAARAPSAWFPSSAMALFQHGNGASDDHCGPSLRAQSPTTLL